MYNFIYRLKILSLILIKKPVFVMWLGGSFHIIGDTKIGDTFENKGLKSSTIIGKVKMFQMSLCFTFYFSNFPFYCV